MTELVERVASALRDRRWEDYEEVWLDAIEAESGSLPEFLQAAQLTLNAGEGERAGMMLALLVPQLEQMDLDDRQAFLEALVSCLPKEREHRTALIALYKERFGAQPGFDTFLKVANLKRTPEPGPAIAQFKKMMNFVPGSFVYHRSGWGVGEITEIRSLEAMAIIDFEERSGHRVSVSAIPDICTLLPPNDFRVMIWRDPDGLQEMAANRPEEIIKSVLRTTGRPMTLARLREAISGKIMPSNQWSKWWARARTALKKDREIGVTGDKAAEYFLREGEADPISELANRVRNADLKTRLKLLREAFEDFPEEQHEQLHRFFDRIQHSLLHRDAEPPLLLEGLLFLHRHGVEAEELPAVSDLLEESGHPGELINGLSRFDDQKEIIDLLREQGAEGWEKLHTELVLGADDAPREYLFTLLDQEDRQGEVDQHAREVNSLPKKAPFFFLWLTRMAAEQNFERIPSLEGISAADFFLRALLLLDDIAARSQHDDNPDLHLQVKRYRQRLSNRPYTIMVNCINHAETRVVREIYHNVEGCRGFSDTIRKRMLAAVLRKHPDVLSATEKRTTTAKIDESTIYATAEAILRKRKELEYMRNEKLPEIYKAIGDAAAMGDLSENYEFTSAIEERENLNRRIMELQAQLDSVVQIDVSQAATDHVSLGSRATLTNLASGDTEVYSVLGPWDGDPEHGVVSYLSPLGLSLMDKKPGQEFEVDLPSGVARYKVENITIHGEQPSGQGVG